MDARARSSVRPLRLVALLLRLGLLNELQYRVNFFVALFQSLLALGTGLAVLALVYANVDELNGWSRPELLVVLGVFTLIGGVVRTVIQPNMLRLMADIQDGTFDYVLTKPVGAQLYISVRDVQIWQSVDLVAGMIVAGVGIARLDQRPTPGAVAAFAAVLVLGILLVYCFWMLITTTAFAVIRMDQITQMFESVMQAGRWPIGIYPGWMRISLTFLVPIAFAVTLPAEALTGRLGGTTLAGAFGFTAAVVVLTRWFFRRGLARYAGASA